jgi:hypothetical protein
MCKPHATEDECRLLIEMKRKAARAAMWRVMSDLGSSPTIAPRIEDVLTYLTNMVYCVELMLKLLSGDWRSHDVGTMYQAVFGTRHGDEGLMRHIKDALVDQKYLFEPNGGLLADLTGLEHLFDELRQALTSRRSGYHVLREVVPPPNFFVFVRDHLGTFYDQGEIELPVTMPYEEVEAKLARIQRAKTDEIERMRGGLDIIIEGKLPINIRCHKASAL